MKRLISLLFISLLTSCSNFSPNAVDPDKDEVFLHKKYKSQVNLSEFNNTGKQYYFIKVWGFLKYYGQFENIDSDNWDNYFIENIDKVKTLDQKEYSTFIHETIDLFSTPEVQKTKNEEKNYSLLDNGWFNNSVYMGKEISTRLTSIFENRKGTSGEFIEQTRIGNIDFTNENSYDDTDYPKKEIRLLGLARYWNIINYFYVYKNDMSENWDTVLLESISKFTNSNEVKAYHIAVQELSSKLYDCHSMVNSQLLDKDIYGRYVPNFGIKLIDSTLIVRKIKIEEWNDGKIKVGDLILKIDGEDALKKYRWFNSIMKGANPLSEQRIICPYLLSSTKDKMKLIISRNGKEHEVELQLKDYYKYNEARDDLQDKLHEGMVLKKYSDDIAYINLDDIANSNFEENFEAARNYKNLIIDIRNYLHGKTTLNLADYIMQKESLFFTSSYSDVTHPGLLRKKAGYKLGSDNDSHYQGNVYVLVNEQTQSESEFLTMALQSSKKVKVIGSQTAGSDGNITQFHFPGNISTIFTGLGIYYPNLVPTQRKGVRLDIELNQTLKGISEGKDEILLKTLEVVRKNNN